ncbi:MAG: diaminopimelate epimerase [Polyangiaceae bacterium]|nr:diaminopimelate epimerase [Polyangiaceae bacterium]
MLRFSKYEGLGNDFIVVDATHATLTRDTARRLCDRHRGVGADGVLLILPPSDTSALARMLVLNADGSRPEMCGNGLRCVARHLVRTGRATGPFVVETDAGPRRCEPLPPDEICFDAGHGAHLGHRTVAHAGHDLGFALVSMGNPHAVTFDAALDERLLDELAPPFSRTFPEGTNVELAAQPRPDTFEVLVWERGVGRTLACGTGAAAVAVAAIAAGRAEPGRELVVRLPGGPLRVVVGPDQRVTATGPAVHVFDGETSLA